MTIKVYKQHEGAALHQAIEHVRSGGLIVLPTDTVYGLGCGVFSVSGIKTIYQLKGREAEKAIAVLLADLEQIDIVAGPCLPGTYHLVERFLPGPLTLVVKKQPGLPVELSTLPTVGIRIPNHPFARALLRACGPMAVTSANLSGHPSSTNITEVIKQFGEQIPMIIDGGQSPGGQSSTVVDCTSEEPRILREGPITITDIQKVWFQKY